MTNVRRISVGSLGNLPHSIGFENIINQIDALFDFDKSVPSYPPHNVIKINDYKYIVQFALAGFTKDEIELQIEDSKLIVKGNKKEPTSDVEYLHKGIGTRAFTKSIPIIDTVEVEYASYEDGILHVGLVNNIPEHKKPKKIEIQSGVNVVEVKDTKKLLVE
jgi:molecular chaperone IbpA